MADLETDDLRQLSQQPQGGPGGDSNGDVDLSDETQDFRFLNIFASSSGKKSDASLPKRGEKDFAPDGTDLQSRILSDSRTAMHTALSGERTHTSKVNVHITWRRDVGKGEVSQPKGTHFKTMGRADREGRVWLEREEVVYLVERGGVECWWEEGVPMSLQGCYAECLGEVGEGWVERYQVYAYLKRAGYIVQGADISPRTTPSTPSTTSTYHPPLHPPPNGLLPTLTHRLLSLLNLHPTPPPHGSLIPPNSPIYSLNQIYSRLSIIPSHNPLLPFPPPPPNTPPQLHITYTVHKPTPTFKKSSPGPADFHICVIPTSSYPSLPSLTDIESLFTSLPSEGGGGYAQKNWMQKLKEGRRGVVLAVVDGGVISFVRLGDVGFGGGRVWEVGGPRRKGKGGRGTGKGGQGGEREGARGGK